MSPPVVVTFTDLELPPSPPLPHASIQILVTPGGKVQVAEEVNVCGEVNIEGIEELGSLVGTKLPKELVAVELFGVEEIGTILNSNMLKKTPP